MWREGRVGGRGRKRGEEEGVLKSTRHKATLKGQGKDDEVEVGTRTQIYPPYLLVAYPTYRLQQLKVRTPSDLLDPDPERTCSKSACAEKEM